MKNALIHIYCGDGKGKTTAAIGIATRAIGSGLSVCFAQFLKNGRSSEIEFLKTSDKATIIVVDGFDGFLCSKTEDEKNKYKEIQNNNLKNINDMAREGLFDVIILDEIIDALNTGSIDNDLVMNFIRTTKNTELVLTGRNPSKELIELSDYVSEIKKIKHPYDRGICAREGIDM